MYFLEKHALVVSCGSLCRQMHHCKLLTLSSNQKLLFSPRGLKNINLFTTLGNIR